MMSLAAAGWWLPWRIGIVDGHSMDPTLHTGQVVAVDRAFYQRHPLSVGDVVFFRGEDGVYVKRIYAVAGQTVYLLDPESGAGSELIPIDPAMARRITAERRENRPGKVRRVLVPDGTFFALGDALWNSEDSRDFGPVPVEKIVGRVLPIGTTLGEPGSVTSRRRTRG